jgi:hypothetical protein
MRLGRGVVWAVLGLVSLLAALWGAGALHFTGPRHVRVRPLGRTLVALAIVCAVFALWWSSVRARDDLGSPMWRAPRTSTSSATA